MIEKVLEEKEVCCAEEMQKLARLSFIMEREIFKSKGFTNPQAYMLMNLLKSGEITMNELSKMMEIEVSTVTRNVEKLIKPGYVQKKKLPEDKRVVIVSLTENGQLKARELKQLFIKHYGSILCNLPKEKSKSVFDAVSILTEIFENTRESGDKI